MKANLTVIESRPSGLLPSEGEWNMLRDQARILMKSGFLPAAVNTEEKAIAIALKGRELGIPFMQALAHINIIQGKPTVSSELMLALIFKNCPGAVINYPKSDDKICTIEAKRPGGKPALFSYSVDEARTAGLLGKDSWKKYPAAMLRARTVAIVARALFPDAIMGCSYIPEELGAEVDEDGDVVDVPNESAAQTERPREIGHIIPEQPGPNDGIQEVGYRVPGHLDPRIKGKMIQNCDPEVLKEVVLSLEAKYRELGKEIPAKGKEFIAEAEKAIGDWENATFKVES